MRARTLAAGSCAVVVALLLAARGASAQSPDPSRAAIRVEPGTVQVGMFYRGTTVRVEGTAPAGWRLALVLLGKEGRVELKQKGKVWNVLWRNVGSVVFERVPSLYLASADLEGVHPDRLSVPADLRLGPGFDAIEARVLPADADDVTRRLFREFIKLKVEERLYSFERRRPEDASDQAVPSGVVLARFGSSTGPARVSAAFSLPASAPPGVYEIRMIGYRDGGGELLATEKLTAERVGLARLVSSMAERHGLLYGILSVILAMAAGLLTGVVFATSRKGH